MLFISPLLTLLSLGLLPIFLWITYKIGNVRRTTSKETQESMASLTAMMQETLSVSGILLTKTFGRQKYAQERFEKENQNLTNLEVRQQMIGRWFFMFIGIFFSIVNLVAYGIGAPIIGRISDKLGVATDASQMRMALLVCPLACALGAIVLWMGSSAYKRSR